MSKVVKLNFWRSCWLVCCCFTYHSLLSSVGAALIKILKVFNEYSSYLKNAMDIQSQSFPGESNSSFFPTRKLAPLRLLSWDLALLGLCTTSQHPGELQRQEVSRLVPPQKQVWSDRPVLLLCHPHQHTCWFSSYCFQQAPKSWMLFLMQSELSSARCQVLWLQSSHAV